MLKARVFDTLSFGYLILIAGIAVIQPLESTYLQLMQNALWVALALFLGLLLHLGLSRWGVTCLGEVIFKPPYQKNVIGGKTLLFWRFQLATLFFVTCVVGVQVTQISLYELTDPDGLAGAWRILKSLLQPEWSVLPQGVLAIVETIFIAFMATVLAIPLAFCMSFFCAKNVMQSTLMGFGIYMGLRSFLNIIRSVEPLIWAIIFTVWVGIGPFAGMLGLMLHSVATLSKQYSELIECVEDGPIEGIVSTGAKSLQVVWFGIVPQVLLPYISFTIYRWDINVRMATLIGLVGGGGIGTMLIQYQGQALWREVGTLVLLIVIVVWGLDTASAYIREAIK